MPVSRSALEFMLTQPPPRQVDERIQKEIIELFLPLRNRVIIIAGMAITIIMIGVLFSLLISRGRYGDELRLKTEATAIAQGTLLNSDCTVNSKGEKTYSYCFEFRPNDSGTGPIRGVCYASDALIYNGGPVAIRYVAAEPSIACMEGCRLNKTSIAVLLIISLVLPIDGIFLYFIFGLRIKLLKQILRDGAAIKPEIRKISSIRSKGNSKIAVHFIFNGQEYLAEQVLFLKKEHIARAEKWQAAGSSLRGLADPGKPKKRFIVLDFIEDTTGAMAQ